MTVSPELLHGFPLFEELSDEQLEWLASRGEEITVPAGSRLFDDGSPVHSFFVLLEGEIELRKRIDDEERVSTRSAEPGVWAGAIPLVDDRYFVSALVTRDSRLFRVRDEYMREMLHRGFPIARHLLMGVRTGTARFQSQLQEHQKLTALGKMAAGLAHELNNPASAARRAAADLARVLEEHDAAWLRLCELEDPSWREEVRRLSADFDQRGWSAPPRSPLERSDAEEEVSARLDDHGVDGAWEMGPSLVDAGVDVGWLDDLARRSGGEALGPLLRWVVSRAAAARMVAEVEHSAGRISELVQAVKTYSYMDRGPVQEVDVREGLESTLTMLRHRLRGIEVERHDEPDLPTVCARGSALNQVWTNLIDNAADAVGESGHIGLRTYSDGGEVVVEVTDDGPGIPPELQHRIFEPFFTTKPPGQGTGLGLDTSYRIVVHDHGGSLTLSSEPGRTTFTVRLPTGPARST